MEILSIGEKIRRARVYKGYTLKYICGDKISVSKMSCIENNKINPEDWILEYVSDKLDLDINYLQEDVKSQIVKNIQCLKKEKFDDYEKKLEYNLEFAINYLYFEQAFEIMHMMLIYNIDKRNFDSIQAIIPKYYDVSLKCKSIKYRLNYYMDIASYLFKFEEYMQAAGYYNTIKKEASEKNEYGFIADATLNECMCYMKSKQYNMANDLIETLFDLIKHFDTDSKIARVYSIKGMLSLILERDRFKYYEKKCYDLFKDDNAGKAEAMYNYAYIMFELGNKEMGISYLKDAINYYPKEDKSNLVQFTLSCIKKFIDNGAVDEAANVIDDVINYAINLDDILYIEKAYHYKSIILGKNKNYISEEMYMTLSLDSLMKFGNKSELCNRYMEIGNMYYNMNNIGEAIKYFNLAINLKKKI